MTTPISTAAEPAAQERPICARYVFGRSALAVLIASVMGSFAAMALHRSEYGVPQAGSGNMFFVLYALHELPFFVLLGLFTAVAWPYVRPVAPGDEVEPNIVRRSRLSPAVALWTAAASIGLLSWAGSYVVLHSFPFSGDEYNAVFQAKIFASGRLAAPLPKEWQPFATALSPVFVTYYPDQHTWRSGYLPVYSAIRALFSLVGMDNLTNPVLGALTVVALAGVGRRLWPDNPRRSWLAVIFLVTSSQFLFTSMSWYSMPAHLLLNLVWLWLYLRHDGVGLALAPIVGVLALGLHNPFPHALFVAPFLVRMLRRRRFGWLAYAAVVYGAGSAVWYSWLRSSYAYQDASGGGLLGAFALPRLVEFKLQALQLSLVLSWQAPLVAIVGLVALLRWRRLGETERDLAGGLLLTASFYFLFPISQGHGWGYRYIYSALGNLIILAATGADLSAEGVGRVRIGRLVTASTLVALLVQWPLRAVQVERFVRPYARGIEYVQTRQDSAVFVHPGQSFYGRDLIRNDPLLNSTPKVLSAPVLGDSGMRRLRDRFAGHVHEVLPGELAPFGVPTF